MSTTYDGNSTVSNQGHQERRWMREDVSNLGSTRTFTFRHSLRIGDPDRCPICSQSPIKSFVGPSTKPRHYFTFPQVKQRTGMIIAAPQTKKNLQVLFSEHSKAPITRFARAQCYYYKGTCVLSSILLNNPSLGVETQVVVVLNAATRSRCNKQGTPRLPLKLVKELKIFSVRSRQAAGLKN